MIEVRHLNFTYSGAGKPTLLDLEFSVQSGEIFGFLGPSGAGKSTTQKILIGLLRDYKGSISVFGRDLPSWKSDYYEPGSSGRCTMGNRAQHSTL
jgi:fluoroquinolone transport system ATP-binding protein